MKGCDKMKFTEKQIEEALRILSQRELAKYDTKRIPPIPREADERIRRNLSERLGINMEQTTQD